MARKQSILILKRKGDHEDHKSHGAWKIAYADFMTALMAFFLMMWLTSSVSDNIRKGLSIYFAPIGASSNILGTGALMDGGESLDELGSLNSMTLEENIFPQIPEYKGPHKSGASDGLRDQKSNKEKAAMFDRATKEEAVFEEVGRTLKGVFRENESLQKYEDQLRVTSTSEGLNIELIEKSGKNMFVVGEKNILPHAKELLAMIARVINVLPNKVRITGHTDARQYGGDSAYNNWDLSIDRARVSRRMLVRFGLNADKVTSVVGRASEELLNKRDPFAPSNRRISILLLRGTPTFKEGKKDEG